MKILYAFVAAAVTFTALDYVWLAHIMKKFYLDNLSHLTTVRDGSLVINFPAAVVFYVLALFTAYWFVVRGATDIQGAFLSGALLGFCMYAFYDFTNLATLRDYPTALALVDTAWGTFLVACVSSVMFFVLS
jgi:uncharacterized membrane protein